jgi:hypothetical protein
MWWRPAPPSVPSTSTSTPLLYVISRPPQPQSQSRYRNGLPTKQDSVLQCTTLPYRRPSRRQANARQEKRQKISMREEARKGKIDRGTLGRVAPGSDSCALGRLSGIPDHDAEDLDGALRPSPPRCNSISDASFSPPSMRCYFAGSNAFVSLLEVLSFRDMHNPPLLRNGITSQQHVYNEITGHDASSPCMAPEARWGLGLQPPVHSLGKNDAVSVSFRLLQVQS